MVKSEIFENAIDSLEFGVSLYLTEEANVRKHAILSIYQSIELFLKERLFREHPLLIYKSLDSKVTNDSMTVGLDDTFARFSNLGIELTDDEIEQLRSFRRRRNQIQHHKYNPNNEDIAAIGKALKYIYNFLSRHLDENLEDYLDDELFNNLRQLIHSYDELLEEARRQAIEMTGPKFKDDPDRLNPFHCPECRTETLVIGTDRGDYCYLCRQDFHLEQCNYCGQYVDPDELDGSNMCMECNSSRDSKE
jgi:hypothetical protein